MDGVADLDAVVAGESTTAAGSYNDTEAVQQNRNKLQLVHQKIRKTSAAKRQ